MPTYIFDGDELITHNEGASYTLTINLSQGADTSILDVMDQQGLLFSGGSNVAGFSGYIPQKLYFKGSEPPGPTPSPAEVFWENDDPEKHGVVSWNGVYRFCSEEVKTGEEIYAFSTEIWTKIKTETFYLDLKATDPVIRVTTGWWTGHWPHNHGDDIVKGDPLLTDNKDGTFTLEINFVGDPILELIDAQHLLFTGENYTPLRIYQPIPVPTSNVYNDRKEEDAKKYHGYLEIQKTEAQQGEVVDVTAHPSENYRLKKDSLRVYLTPDANSQNIDLKSNDDTYTFVMPNMSVTVTAEFEPDHNHVITLVKGKSPTILTPGFKDYYTCEACGECYEDIEGKILIIDLDAWKNGAGKLDATLGVGSFSAILVGAIGGALILLLGAILIAHKKKLNLLTADTSMFTGIQYRKTKSEDPAFDEYIITFTYQDRTLPYYIFRKKSEHATVEDIKKQFNKVMKSGKLTRYINKVTGKKELY